MHAEARTSLVDGSARDLAEVTFGWATGPGSPCESASATCTRAIELAPDRTTASLCPARTDAGAFATGSYRLDVPEAITVADHTPTASTTPRSSNRRTRHTDRQLVVDLAT